MEMLEYTSQKRQNLATIWDWKPKQLKNINYFRKTLDLRCLPGFWIHLYEPQHCISVFSIYVDIADQIKSRILEHFTQPLPLFIYFKFFKGCLPKISLGPFLKTLSHLSPIWQISRLETNYTAGKKKPRLNYFKLKQKPEKWMF